MGECFEGDSARAASLRVEREALHLATAVWSCELLLTSERADEARPRRGRLEQARELSQPQ